jgi:SAM-dependent methyltransferase
MANPTSWYDSHAADVVHAYEGVDPAKLHGWINDLISKAPGTVLDIGAGTGRDAAWFAGRGYDVVAVEPSSGMSLEGRRLHPDPRIRWIEDQLPGLSAVGPLGISFDLVMVTAVWQHVPSSERERAFRQIAGLVKSGGLLAISLRTGPAPADRGMYPVSLDEVERLARNHGFAVEKVHHARDQQGRGDVSWTSVALRLPDDGTGALPLLRHVILNDQKSATYKLGLLRTLCRVADGSAGMVRDAGEEFVSVPLGLIALNWLRLYMPLIREGLPQTPTNVGASGLGFAKDGLRNLLPEVSPSDLRVGFRFTQARARYLHTALRDAAQTIDRMPSTFMTYPTGGQILPVKRDRLGLTPDAPIGGRAPMIETKAREPMSPLLDDLPEDNLPEPVALTPEQIAAQAEADERDRERQLEWDRTIRALNDNSMAVFRAMRKFRHEDEEEYVERVLTSFEDGRFLINRLGAGCVLDQDLSVVLLDLRRRLIDEYGNTPAATMLIDRAVSAYQDFMRVSGWTGNLSIHIEHEFFGLNGPGADFRDRYGREGRNIRGLSVEEHLAHLREGLLPLAERCGRVMREALAALEALRALPSQVVERSKPIRISVMFGSTGPGGIDRPR